MKQAILITAYKNLNHLEEIIKFFDDNFEIYIHIDRKSELTPVEIARLMEYRIVKSVTQKYKVNWGGFNHLQAILHLSELALQNPDNFFFHLISGHDFPIKEKENFIEYFKQNKNLEFISCFGLPKPKWADNGGKDRIEYYNFYDILNAKIPDQNGMIRRIVRFQKYLGFKRTISSKMPKLYGGSTWWSLSRDCLSYVINYTKNNKFVLRRFRNTLCSEEFYFPTVIMNSIFSLKVENTNLRYIDWVARNGNNPAILDESDYENLMETKAFFARKFEPKISSVLLKKIKETITCISFL